MKYLVTGGAGFIGSNIVEELLKRGETVRVVDSMITGRKANIEPFLDRIEFIEGDLAEPKIAARSVKGVEVVLHQAALPSVPRSVADPVGCIHNCVEATVSLLEAARGAGGAGVRRVVLASSSSIYGGGPEMPKCETMAPAPHSPYAAAKLACELYAGTYGRLHGLSTVCLRYFNVFGPRQDPASQYAAVVPAFITAALEGRSPTIYGDGGQSRDFTFVANVVRANLLAASAERELAGEVANIACGRKHSLLDLLAEVCRVAGKSVEPIFEDERPGDVRESLADVTRAGELFGYQPQVSFADGLALTVESFREKQ